MTIKRILLWTIPIFFVASLIIFTVAPLILEKQGAGFQQTREEGWKTYLQENKTNGFESGARQGDMLIDTNGNIWVAGGAGLDGLHTFDGTEWTSSTGRYNDLAIDPQGKIYAVHNLGDSVDGVDVFDGQDWQTYEGPPGDHASKQQIIQVEVDQNGRIWIVTNDFGTERVLEMFINDGKATFAQPAITITNGSINSLDADDDGNMWAAISHYEEPWTSGLYILHGEEWQKVPDQDLNLQDVRRTTFDNQGNVFVATGCGGILTYDGTHWETITTENTDPNCIYDTPTLGITVDNQGGIWTWNYESVSYLDDTSWTTFTPENSGFAEVSTYGPNVTAVIIDDLDRVWINSGEGVGVGAIAEIQPTSESTLNQNDQTRRLLTWMQDKNWLIPLMLALLWLALYFNMPRSITLSLIIGLFISFMMGPLILQPFSGYSMELINPAFLIMVCGILGGILGGIIYKTHKSKIPWDIIVMVFGLIVGLGLSALQYLFSVP